MIYNRKYRIKFYRNPVNGQDYVYDYINNLERRHRLKIYKYIEFLRDRGGYIDEPYGRHIVGKIRELRVNFGNNRYRILYFMFTDKRIILLHIFRKITNKTPVRDIKVAVSRYNKFLANFNLYEKDN